MSGVTPKPAAAFSTLAIDEIDLMMRDERRRGRAARARVPGRPTMSPMKRRRVMRAPRGIAEHAGRGDRRGAAGRRAAGRRDGERARAARVERAGQPDGAREPAVAALGQVKARARIGAPARASRRRRAACCGGRRRAASPAATPGTSTTTSTAAGGFEDVERRPALGGERGDARHVAIELDQQPPRVFGEIRRVLVRAGRSRQS